jgi:hypothetical protein
MDEFVVRLCGEGELYRLLIGGLRELKRWEWEHGYIDIWRKEGETTPLTKHPLDKKLSISTRMKKLQYLGSFLSTHRFAKCIRAKDFVRILRFPVAAKANASKPKNDPNDDYGSKIQDYT